MAKRWDVSARRRIGFGAPRSERVRTVDRGEGASEFGARDGDREKFGEKTVAPLRSEGPGGRLGEREETRRWFAVWRRVRGRGRSGGSGGGGESARTGENEGIAASGAGEGVVWLSLEIVCAREWGVVAVARWGKTKSQHLFSEIGRKVSYYVEVTAFVEEGRMRNLTGVKSKELLIWVGISDIFVGDHNNGKITFGTSSGLSRTFPVSAFQ
ncbi:coiled-coil domain-containing protein [Tanacetum coccineum]